MDFYDIFVSFQMAILTANKLFAILNLLIGKNFTSQTISE